jgi:hypothetical protein
MYTQRGTIPVANIEATTPAATAVVGAAALANLAKFVVAPGTSFSAYGGRLALSAPEWYSSKKNAEYPWGEPGFTCTCEQFNKITRQAQAGAYVPAAGAMAWTYQISYDAIKTSLVPKSKAAKDKLTIECSHWRNPILPTASTGFVL